MASSKEENFIGCVLPMRFGVYLLDDASAESPALLLCRTAVKIQHPVLDGLCIPDERRVDLRTSEVPGVCVSSRTLPWGLCTGNAKILEVFLVQSYQGGVCELIHTPGTSDLRRTTLSSSGMPNPHLVCVCLRVWSWL